MTENINQENINQENNIVITNDPIHLITNQEIDNEENNQSIVQKHSDLLVLIKQKNLSPKKRNLILKIKKYQKFFSNKLNDISDILDINNLLTYDENMLSNLINEIKYSINDNTNIETGQYIIHSLIIAYEKLLQKIKFETNNFTQELIEDEGFNNDIIQLLLDLDNDSINFSPFTRLTFKILITTFKNVNLMKQEVDSKIINIEDNELVKLESELNDKLKN